MNRKENFIYLNVTEDERKHAKEYDKERKSIKTVRTRIYNPNQNDIGRLPEVAIHREFYRNGYQITDNYKKGEGNEYDFILHTEGKRELHEVKCIQFDSGRPTEKWLFPIFMKSWVKMYDWTEDKQKIDVIHCTGYDKQKDDIIYYGWITPNELIKLWREQNVNDDVEYKARKVKYFPVNYKLANAYAKEDGIVMLMECLHSYSELF
jgi:hypothetical protein